ncbi:MAG: DUF429 domain-containing protein [Stellaceae bacterium]
MPMMDAVGIDGCRGGWVAVSIEHDGRRQFRILRVIDELIGLGNVSAMIDIPIGLPSCRVLPRFRMICLTLVPVPSRRVTPSTATVISLLVAMRSTRAACAWKCGTERRQLS